jgi:hypothetical protein
MATNRLLVCIAAMLITFGVVLAQPPAGAQDDVIAIADALKKGNADDAKKLAAAAAQKLTNAQLMHLYKPRNKGGMGYSSTAGKNPATDGLEKKIQEFAKGVPQNLVAQVAANEEAALWMAALAEITLAKAPAKNGPQGKTIKAWTDWSNDLRKASTDFAKAAAAKDAKDMSKHAAKMYSTCVACHSKFKD